MLVTCVGCNTTATLDALAASVCAKCGAPQRLAGRFVALQRSGVVRSDGLDEVEGAAPLFDGVDLKEDRKVVLRVAGPDHAPRLEREATVLRGVNVSGVPKVVALEQVDGIGSVLALEDVGVPLERTLLDGLRTDGARVRGLLRGALRILVELHALSPPVFHRHLHSGTLTWDGQHGVGLRDFARATDTLEDHATDRVLPRAGFFPQASDVTPAQVDLYGLGAVAIHVLSRRTPDSLAVLNGIPDFRAHVTVDEPLVAWLERLLAVGTRRGFSTAREALDALPGEPAAQRPQTPLFPLLAAAGVVVLGAGALITALTLGERPPRTVITAPVVPVEPPPVAPPPTPPTPPSRPPPRTHTAPPASDLVHLKVTSVPSGAQVTFNGVARGQTPLELDTAPVSKGDVTLTLAGFEPAGRKFMLLDDVALHVELVKKPGVTAPPPQPPQPQIIVPKLDDAWRKSVERAVASHKAQLLVCGKDGVDRTRIKLAVRGDGSVDGAEPLGQAQMESTRCVKAALQGMTFPSRGDQSKLSVDVWVYFKPDFRVAVY